MNTLLTLAISEMEPGNFKIVAADLNKNVFYSLELKEKDFFDEYGTPVWDLFAITSGIKVVSTYRLHKIIGKAYIQKYYTKDEMKKFFDSKLMLLDTFIKNDTYQYGIFKLQSIKLEEPKFINKNGRKILRQYLHLPNRRLSKKPIRLLNKDYKWITYWENIPKDLWEVKVKHWESYINSSNKEVYAIGYSMRFNNRRIGWICGFHCL